LEVNNGLVGLLGFDKKREVVAYSRSLVVGLQGLAELIDAVDLAPEVIGLRHLMCRREIVPAHVQLSGDDFDCLVPGSDAHTAKAVRKVFQFFRERNVLVGHMLHTPKCTRWHFFYFTERDLTADHWAHGAHLHFVNWLWPEYSARSVWEQFQSERALDLNSIHIRFDESIVDA
jgi:hypothetical protein